VAWTLRQSSSELLCGRGSDTVVLDGFFGRALHVGELGFKGGDLGGGTLRERARTRRVSLCWAEEEGEKARRGDLVAKEGTRDEPLRCSLALDDAERCPTVSLGSLTTTGTVLRRLCLGLYAGKKTRKREAVSSSFG
jgi:hypothetical protein